MGRTNFRPGSPRVCAGRADCFSAHRGDGGPGPRTPHLHDAAGRFARPGAAGRAELLRRLQHAPTDLHHSRHAVLAGPADQRRASARCAGYGCRLPGLDRDQQPALVWNLRRQREPAAAGHPDPDRRDQCEHGLRLHIRAGLHGGQSQPAVELSDMRRRQRRRRQDAGTPAGRGRSQAALEAGAQHPARDTGDHHVRFAVGRTAGVLMRSGWAVLSGTSRGRREGQSGQVLVIVAVWLIALIGSAALILLTGSVEWQRNQLQQLADQAALDAALKIGVSCTAGSASTIITEADNFVATQRTRTGVLNVGAGTCAGGYTGTDSFAPGITETIHYPYRLHQQQVEVILTLALPISFGSYMGASNTNVTRRAVGQQLSGSVPAVSATTLSCTGGQFNVQGSVVASNAITLSGGCAVYSHTRFDAASSTYSDMGNVSVYAAGQTWVGGGGSCTAGSTSGSTNAACADGYEISGHNAAVTCGASGTSAFLSAGDAAINANPCAAGKGPQPVAPVPSTLPPEPNT